MSDVKINKHMAVDTIAYITGALAEKKLEAGDAPRAKDLLADSARIYEYLSAFRESKSGIRTLQRALELARRAENPTMAYGLALKLSDAVLEPYDQIPKTEFGVSVLEHGEVVDGLARVSEIISDSRCTYLYRIRMDEESMSRLLERLGDSEFGKFIEQSMKSISRLADGERENISIEFEYRKDRGVLSIFSRHTLEDHMYVRDAINMFASSLGHIARP